MYVSVGICLYVCFLSGLSACMSVSPSFFIFICLTLSFVCTICTVCLTFFGMLLGCFVGIFIHSDVLANVLATVMFVIVSVPLLKVCEHV